MAILIVSEKMFL